MQYKGDIHSHICKKKMLWWRLKVAWKNACPGIICPDLGMHGQK
jgi:hypothetical protein